MAVFMVVRAIITYRWLGRLANSLFPMKEGYVYILSNPSMTNLIKIGQTRRSPEERARELSRNTSIPVDFIVEFEMFTLDRLMLEKVTHEKLEPYRFNKKREFFEIGVEEAAKIIRVEADKINERLSYFEEGVNTTFDKYEAVEILGMLKDKFPHIIRPEIKSVRIYQTALRCYLEITEEKAISADREVPLVDQTIKRQDMGYIIADADFDELMFDPTRTVFENARKFIEEFDAYSTLVTCSELFTEEGCNQIQDEYFSAKREGPQGE